MKKSKIPLLLFLAMVANSVSTSPRAVGQPAVACPSCEAAVKACPECAMTEAAKACPVCAAKAAAEACPECAIQEAKKKCPNCLIDRAEHRHDLSQYNKSLSDYKNTGAACPLCEKAARECPLCAAQAAARACPACAAAEAAKACPLCAADAAAKACPLCAIANPTRFNTVRKPSAEVNTSHPENDMKSSGDKNETVKVPGYTEDNKPSDNTTPTLRGT